MNYLKLAPLLLLTGCSFSILEGSPYLGLAAFAVLIVRLGAYSRRRSKQERRDDLSDGDE